MSVLIKGGRDVTADDDDDYVEYISVEDGKVSLIGASLDVRADKVIDAGGKYVIPGAIDPHTHMEMPFGGTVSCDDFTSGTTSPVPTARRSPSSGRATWPTPGSASRR